MIFLRRISYEKPLQRIPEHQAERGSEAVRIENQPHEVFHGLNITDNQALEYGRLGIREKLGRTMERWFPGRQAGNQILDERVTQKLKDICAREISVRQQERGWIVRNLRRAVGFVRNVRAIPYREHADNVGQVFEDIYDRNTGVRGLFQRWILRYDRLPLPVLGAGPVTVDRMRTNLARDIWNGLSTADKGAISTNSQTLRQIVGVPIGPLSPQEVMAALSAQQTTPEQLEQIRRESNAPGLGIENFAPLFPASERRPSPTLYDRLIQMKQVEANEKKKLTNKTVYDATRLQDFLDNRLRPQTAINNLVHEILVENALYPIENNPDAQALVAYLEYRLNHDSTFNVTEGTPPVTTLRLQIQQDLESIRGSLPSREEKADDKEKSETQERLESVQKYSDTIQESYNSLKDQYAECPGIGQRIYELRRQLANTPAPTATGTVTGSVTINDQARENISKQIEKAIETQSKLLTNINKLETKYKDSATNLLATLNEIDPALLPTLNNLNTYNGLNIPSYTNSTPDQLFGPPQPIPAGGPFVNWAANAPSLIQQHITCTTIPGSPAVTNGFTQMALSSMFKEIKDNYHKAIKKKKPEQLTCRQLLYMLKEGDLVRQGITNQELRRKLAFRGTNEMIVEVKNTSLYESCSERLSERLGGSIIGIRILARLKKVLAAYGGSRKNMLGQDVIALTAGMNEKYSVFRPLKRDATITELRELMAANGGIDQQTLFEFAEQLKEVLIGFNMLKKEGTVNLFDRHAVQLEGLVNLLQVVQQEMRSEKFFQEIRGSSGNIAHAVLKKIKEDEVASEKLEKDLHEQFSKPEAEWKQMFAKRNFEKKFLAKYREARKYVKDNKMTEGEAEDYIKTQGLIAANDNYSTRETARETWDSTKEKANKAYEGVKTSKITAAASTTGEYVVYKPLKFMAYDAPKLTLEKAWGIASFPFRLVGALGTDLGKIGKKKDKADDKGKEKQKLPAGKPANDNAKAKEKKAA